MISFDGKHRKHTVDSGSVGGYLPCRKLLQTSRTHALNKLYNLITPVLRSVNPVNTNTKILIPSQPLGSVSVSRRTFSKDRPIGGIAKKQLDQNRSDFNRLKLRFSADSAADESFTLDCPRLCTQICIRRPRSTRNIKQASHIFRETAVLAQLPHVFSQLFFDKSCRAIKKVVRRYQNVIKY